MRGRDMKKAFSFISDYSWLLKLGMWLGIILWAAQVGPFFYAEYLKIKNRPDVSIYDRMELNREMDDFSQEIHRKAKLNADKYTPKDYFNDLYLLQMKRDEIEKKYGESPMNYQAYELQAILEKNRESKKFNDYQLKSESRAHSQKLQNRIPNEFKKELDAMSKEEKVNFFSSGFHRLLDWLFTLYARGTLLAWGLFFLRMRERKGILATILGDKKMFALAMIFWPALLLKYPSNLIREIVVEAELRRIGDFFRQLTADEKKIIRQVAQSRDIFGWIRRFREENFYLFQRSFAMALLAVVVVNFICIGESNADEINSIRAGTSIGLEIYQGDGDCTSLESKTLKLDADYKVFIADNLSSVKIYPCFFGLLVFLETIFRKQEFIKRIEHIPVCQFC